MKLAMEIFAFVFMFALSKAMVLQPLIAKKSMISVNTTDNVDCSVLGAELLTFAYSPDQHSPNALTKKGILFNDEDGMVLGTFNQHAHQFATESSDLTKSTQDIASSLSVSGSYMAFSGSASLKFSTGSSSQHESMRRTVKLQSFQCELHASDWFKVKPQDYLTQPFKYVIEHNSADWIADNYGAFYATKVELGGQFSTTYIMEKSDLDTSQTFSAEIEASYTGPVSVNGSGSTSVQQRQNSNSARIERKLSWLGGDTSVILAAPSSVDDSRNHEWASTFTTDNLYPFSYELHPIWELISLVNAEKGKAVEEAFAAIWSSQFSQLNSDILNMPKLPFDPRLTDHAARNNAKAKAQERKVACQGEADSAQSWIDTWWAFADQTRNKNWRRAAQDCQTEMDAIKTYLDDNSKTVQEFVTWMTDLYHDRDSAGNKYWGINGNDSTESNRVNKASAAVIRTIKLLFH